MNRKDFVLGLITGASTASILGACWYTGFYPRIILPEVTANPGKIVAHTEPIIIRNRDNESSNSLGEKLKIACPQDPSKKASRILTEGPDWGNELLEREISPDGSSLYAAVMYRYKNIKEGTESLYKCEVRPKELSKGKPKWSHVTAKEIRNPTWVKGQPGWIMYQNESGDIFTMNSNGQVNVVDIK